MTLDTSSLSPGLPTAGADAELTLKQANVFAGAVLAQPLSVLVDLTPVQQRILSRIRVNDRGCWVWQGATSSDYGRMGNGEPGGTEGVHRLAYRAWRGELKRARPLDHEKCDNPPCCNPWHLEPKTNWENLSRSKTNPFAQKARATHCVNDHEFTPENTYIHPSRGTRHCRQCKRDREAVYHAARAGDEKETHRGPRRGQQRVVTG